MSGAASTAALAEALVCINFIVCRLPLPSRLGQEQSIRIYDEQVITECDPQTVVEYPKWSRDESLIIYDSNKLHGGGQLYQLYAYRLSDGAEENISPDHDLNYQVCSIRGIPK